MRRVISDDGLIMASESPAPYRLTLLGPWDLRGPKGKKVRSVLAQPKRLCLLAYLALEAEPISRSTLVSLFWPERDEDRARNALSQSLHYLRRSLGPNVVESVEGDRVRVGPESVWLDARALLNGSAASASSDSALGHALGSGRDFFPGWNADDSQPLQDWLDEVRRRVRKRAEEVGGGEGRSAGESRTVHEGGGIPGETAGQRTRSDDDHGASVGGSRGIPGGPGGGRGGARGADFPRASRRWSRAAWVWGGVALGILLTLGILRVGPGPPAGGGATAGALPEITILFPRVTVLGEDPRFSSEALAQAVHDELIVQLGAMRQVRPVFISFESEVAQLVRSLQAQGAADRPDWVLSVGIRTAGEQVRVVALLLRGPDYTQTERANAGAYLVPPGAEALIDLPRRIAAEMVVGVGEAVGGKAGT